MGTQAPSAMNLQQTALLDRMDATFAASAEFGMKTQEKVTVHEMLKTGLQAMIDSAKGLPR